MTRVDSDLSSSRPQFQWNAIDTVSRGVVYRAKIGDGDWFDPAPYLADATYVLPPQSPTKSRMLSVRAYDQAGNFSASAIEFSVWSPNGWQVTLQQLLHSIELWWWLIVGVIIAVFGIIYLIRRAVLGWRTELQKELYDFRTNLYNDIKRLEAGVKEGEVMSPEDIRFALARELKHIEGDVTEELNR
jgi:hypothetical protein